MKPVIPALLALCLGAAALGSASTLPDARAAAGYTAGASPAAVFRPLLPRLARTHIPVYLPSWLPAFKMRVYPIGGVVDHGNGYFAYLSTRKSGFADADLVFTLDAGMSPPDTTGRRVALRGGLFGHIDPHTGGNRGPTLAWAVGRYSYEIGYLYPEGKLIRAARSMVRVR
jgi:hypothetical protein